MPIYNIIMIGKFVTKLIQSLPTWEVTKYYGRVCIYQLKCLKYKVQTSEAWFNFKCKFMPGSLRNELECEEPTKIKDKAKQQHVQQTCKQEQVEQKASVDANIQQKQNQAQYAKYNEQESAKNSVNNVKSPYMSKNIQEHNNEHYQEKEDYSMGDDYQAKKQRKMKRAQ